MTNILTINPGSTAVKYVLFNSSGDVLDNKKFDRKEGGLEVGATEQEWVSGLQEVERVGIRIVHGGDLCGPLEFTPDVHRQVNKFTKFAPIHNMVALSVVKSVQEIFPGVRIIASLDTDFHKTMPAAASTYPINTKIAQKYNIKRYGFHGLALQSVLSQLESANLEARLPSKIICAHLGGGCSVTAVLEGKSIDTTMGLTPLEGLMMITRSGSLDPAIIAHITSQSGQSADEAVDMLNNESGLYGITGSKNTIDIISRASKRQEPEKLAFDMFVDRIVKQIFAYYGTLQGCDALIISGGIGYGNVYLRAKILEKVAILGIAEQNTFVYQADEARVLFENTVKV